MIPCGEVAAFLYSNDFPRQDFLHFFGSIFHFHNMKQAENRHP